MITCDKYNESTGQGVPARRFSLLMTLPDFHSDWAWAGLSSNSLDTLRVIAKAYIRDFHGDARTRFKIEDSIYREDLIGNHVCHQVTE